MSWDRGHDTHSDICFKLRPYQEDAVHAVGRDLEKHNKLLVVIPTGGGKTEVFLKVASNYYDKFKKPVLILSHMSVLTEQIIERSQLRIPDKYVGKLQAGAYPTIFDNIIVGTMQTTKEKKHLTRCLKIIDKPGLVIVDECHRVLTNSYDDIFKILSDSKLLGVTATPFKENQIMTDYFDKISYSISTRELLEQGYLVPPILHQIVRDDNDIVNVIAQVVAIYKKHEMGKSALVYMKTIEDAKMMRNAFQESGVSSEAVTSEITGTKRDEIIKAFSNGTTKVLTTVDVLSTGFDSKRIEAIIQPYATKSVVLYLQRIGRGLRLSPETGKNSCRVYVFGDSPSISRNFYERIQNIALNKGGEIREYDTVTEDFEFNDYTNNGQEYQWTKQLLKVINKLNKAGLKSLSSMIDKKQFPKRYLANIIDLLQESRLSKVSNRSGQITEKQDQVLRSLGFVKSQVETLTKKEASVLISMLIQPNKESAFTIQKGKHKGKHVADLPWAYRKVVLSKFPNSEIAGLIRKWLNR